MEDLKLAFRNDVMECMEKCKNELGYNPTRFIEMLNKHDNDAVAVAKILIAKGGTNVGFENLWEAKRLKWTSEARALRPEFRSLFTEEELIKAKETLKKYNFDFKYDDLVL